MGKGGKHRRRGRRPLKANKNLELRRFDGPVQIGERATPERASRGGLLREALYEGGRDGAGEPTGTLILKAYRQRDRNADVRNRLLAMRHPFTADQIAAAVLFEADHEASHVSPKVTANLHSAGGGSNGYGVEIRAASVLAAGDRLHHARQALRLAGEAAVRIVEAVVLHGSTSRAASADRYARGRDQNIRTLTTLELGLTLLSAHYQGRAGGNRIVAGKPVDVDAPKRKSAA